VLDFIRDSDGTAPLQKLLDVGKTRALYKRKFPDQENRSEARSCSDIN
jgi:hypothetical protein